MPKKGSYTYGIKINIKRIDPELAMPEYKTSGAACFDLITRETTTLASWQVVLIPTNIVVEVPDGYFLMVTSRSSTARRKGLHIPMGIIDQDYCGPEDEVLVQAWNLTDFPVTIERGERIAQAGFVRVDRAIFAEVQEMENENRGGFGTTGNA